MTPTAPFSGRKALVLIGIGLVCRLCWWFTHISVIENEGVEYARIAQTWFSGQGYLGILGGPEVMFPPAYPGLIGLFAWIVGDVELAGRIVSLIAGLALIAVTYLLTLRVFGNREGLVAGIIVATHPLLVALSVSMYSESLAICLLMSSALFAVKAVSQTDARGLRPAAAALSSGVIIGFAYLTRPEMILLAPVLAVFLVAADLRTHRRWARAVRLGGLSLLACVLIALPYMVHLSLVAGSFRWEGKTAANEVINERMQRGLTYPQAARGLDVAGDFDKAAPYFGGPDLWGDQSVFLRPSDYQSSRGPKDLIFAMPTWIHGAIRLIAWAGLQWTSIWRFPLGIIAALVGFVGSRWWGGERWAEASLLLVLWGVQAAFLLGVLFLFSRYAYPLFPLVIPWMATGLVWLCDRGLALRKSPPAEYRRLLVATLAVFLALVLSASGYRRVVALDDFHQSADLMLKEKGLWIRSLASRTSGARPIIMGYGAVVPFYADGILGYLPNTDDVDRAMRFVHWTAPDFIVLRSSETSQGPYFKAWLAEGIPDRCALPLHHSEGPTGQIRIWRWTCTR